MMLLHQAKRALLYTSKQLPLDTELRSTVGSDWMVSALVA
jgi:hypothetical protein